MMELISRAIHFATDAHDGMRRKKGNLPYILHPMEAAVIVGTMTSDQEVIAAAVLHDVVEDAGITLADIEKEFGKRVAELVATETEDKRADLPPETTWQVRKEESLEILKNASDSAVLMVWLGDKLANMRAIYREWLEDGDFMWQRFNQKDPVLQGWYYRTIAKLTEKLNCHPVWHEYDRLTISVFGKGE